MPTTKQIEILVQEIGPLWESVVQILGDGESRWGILLEEDTLLQLWLADDQGKAVLHAEAGAVPAESGTKLFRAMLEFNALWEHSGGIAIALGDGDLLQLRCEIAHEDLRDSRRFVRILQQFTSLLMAWRQCLAAPVEDEAAPVEPDDLPLMRV